jgi:hypothetical protein
MTDFLVSVLSISQIDNTDTKLMQLSNDLRLLGGFSLLGDAFGKVWWCAASVRVDLIGVVFS